MTPGLDAYRDSYRDAVNSSIGFSGADVEFFACTNASTTVP